MKKIFFVVLIMVLTMLSCQDEGQNVIKTFTMYPNPYSAESKNATTFRIQLRQSVLNVPIEIVITDSNHQEIWRFQGELSGGPGLPIDVEWRGENNNGITLSPGIYMARVFVGGSLKGEKWIDIMIL